MSLSPQVRHPGNLQAAFSLPLNVFIRGPQYLKACGFPPPRHPGNLQAGVNGFKSLWIPDNKFRE